MKVRDFAVMRSGLYTEEVRTLHPESRTIAMKRPDYLFEKSQKKATIFFRAIQPAMVAKIRRVMIT